jgi:hypothetical protein
MRLLPELRAGAGPAPGPAAARGLPVHRAAVIAGVVCLAAVLFVVDVPGLLDVRRNRSAAAVFSHVTLTVLAFGLSPRFPGWVARAASLSSRQRVWALMAALVGPLAVIFTGLLMFPSYGHEVFTREWGIVEPLQFVLWLTATWLALERGRLGGPGTPDQPAFRLAAVGCVLLALEEVDYLGIVTLVARLAGVPGGRINRHHIGGLHDVINDLGKISLLLGVLALAAVAALVLAWARSQGLHRVVLREIFSSTSLPLVGTVVFLGISQLADIDHPILAPLLGQFAVVRRMREEPLELLAVICVNASLIAKLSPFLKPAPSSGRATSGRARTGRRRSRGR